MKKFKFRLEKIRQFRENEANHSKRELASKINNLKHSEDIYEQLCMEKQRQKLAYDNILTSGDLYVMGEYENFLQSLIEKQASLVQEAKNAVEIAREELLIKARDEKALSLLKERSLEDFMEEVKKSQKKEQESLAMRNYMVRQEFDGEK